MIGVVIAASGLIFGALAIDAGGQVERHHHGALSIRLEDDVEEGRIYAPIERRRLSDAVRIAHIEADCLILYDTRLERPDGAHVALPSDAARDMEPYGGRNRTLEIDHPLRPAR